MWSSDGKFTGKGTIICGLFGQERTHILLPSLKDKYPVLGYFSCPSDIVSVGVCCHGLRLFSGCKSKGLGGLSVKGLDSDSCLLTVGELCDIEDVLVSLYLSLLIC